MRLAPLHRHLSEIHAAPQWLWAEVYKSLSRDNDFKSNGFVRQLAEIHAAPRWLWPILVHYLLTEEWTVETTKKHVAAVQKLDEPPAWVHLE